MRSLTLALTAIAAIGIALPVTAPAKAETLVVRGHDRDRDHARFERRDMTGL